MIPASVALTNGLINRRLLSGQVKIQGLDAHFSSLHPSELFWRQLHYAEFDISELSLASLMIAYSNGDRTWTALPVFTTRRFFHTEALVRADSGIDHPTDLVGRRVGVPEFQQTAAVWARGALLHEFGVDQTSLHWFMERDRERSHAAATGSTFPPNVKIELIPGGASLATALTEGVIDAALHYVAGANFIDRSNARVSDLVGVRPLFADPIAEGVRYFRKTGILPMNHCLVVRRSLIEREPWLALNLYDAFLEAKELALTTVRHDAEHFVALGLIPLSGLKEDPLPLGFRSEGHQLKLLSSYLSEQQLISAPIDISELFSETVLDV